MSEARGMGYGLLLGAGLMFLLDPRQGNTRRAVVRDKSRKAVRDVEDAIQIGTRDLSHRIEGAIATMLGARHEEVADDVLVARVRARLGHVCSHAHAIQVNAKGRGCIELKGPVLQAEHDRIVSVVSRIPGVRDIDDDLEVRVGEGEVPHLGTIGPWWNPSTRLAIGVTSAGLALSSLLRGSAVGVLLGSAGVLGIARTMTHRQLPRVKSLEHEREGVHPLREAYREGSEWARDTPRGS